MDRCSNPQQLRDAVTRRGTGVGPPPEPLCKANARHTFSCGRDYLGVLRGLLMDIGCKVDVEPRRLHQLTGEHPVDWITGSALVPECVSGSSELAAVSAGLIPLPNDARHGPDGTFARFRQLFMVAEVGGARRSGGVTPAAAPPSVPVDPLVGAGWPAVPGF